MDKICAYRAEKNIAKVREIFWCMYLYSFLFSLLYNILVERMVVHKYNGRVFFCFKNWDSHYSVFLLVKYILLQFIESSQINNKYS